MTSSTVKREAMPTVRKLAEAKAAAPKLAGTDTQVAEAFYSRGRPVSGVEGTDGEIWLYGIVGGWWSGFDAEGVADALRNMKVENLTVRIHSPGGLASDGVAIGNLLRNYDANVTVVIDGIAASAASVIALAGNTVVMCPGSQIMVHDAMTGVYGSAEEIRKVADWIDGQSANYAEVYAGRAGNTAEHWRGLMTANGRLGTWFTAEGAVKAGLADEVGTRTAVSSPPTSSGDDEWDDDTWALAQHDLELMEHYVHAAARAVWNGETPKPPSASAVGSTETEGGSAVAFSDEQITELRSTLGLADDADEAAIVAAAAEVVDKVTEPAPEADTSKASIPEGHVVVSAAKLADLEAGAAAGTEAAAKLHAKERDEFLTANASKFAPANRDAWAKEYDRDAEGTRKHFAQAPALVPTSELGHANDPEDGENATSDAVATVRESDAYKNWSI